jgi:hypothetical protein
MAIEKDKVPYINAAINTHFDQLSGENNSGIEI